MKHFQLTYEEARATAEHKWIDPQDYARQPWMTCRTGDAHASGTRQMQSVTCKACLAGHGFVTNLDGYL